MSLLVIWYVATLFLPPNVMPPPHVVIKTLIAEMLAGRIWIDVAISLTRIAFAFSIAVSVALVLGFAMGLSRLAERFFDVWMICGITVPSLVIILTTYMVVGLNDRAAVLAAALPVVPILTINIWKGIKGIDAKLIDMAKAYRAPRRMILTSIVAPQVAPALMASARFGLGLIWKMVLFVELLGRSDGVGYKIEFYYQMFNMSEVLAHALCFLFIMLFLEFGVIGRAEAKLFAWRPQQRDI